jgi:hypothetical protein
MKRLLLTLTLLGAVQASPLGFGVPVVQESSREQASNLSRNAEALRKLQQAAAQCADMRLVMAESAEARVRRPVEMARLSAPEQEQMRGLIARMQPVKTAPAGDFALPHVVRLELLGQAGQVLAGVNYMDVAPEGLVTPQGYAAGSRYMLCGSDAAAWHLLLRAGEARSIASNPAPTRLSSRPPRLHKRPEPAPAVEVEHDIIVTEPYYHTNCSGKHKGHKHKGKNHYCTHPQH